MNCDCNCNAKCRLLGGLEQKIMDVLWTQPHPQKPSDVVKTLGHSHAYTTITTVLKRMFDKGLVTRHQKGHVFYYQASTDKSTYACDCLDDLFKRLFDSYGSDVTTAYHRASKSQKSTN